MRPTDGKRGGFSLIELLVAMSIIGILAGLAIPNMRNVTLRARATAVFGDINVMRQATLDYNAEQSAWPPDESSGTIPAGLVPFLPDGFSFQGDGYELDFENQNLPLRPSREPLRHPDGRGGDHRAGCGPQQRPHRGARGYDRIQPRQHPHGRFRRQLIGRRAGSGWRRSSSVTDVRLLSL